MLVVSPEVIRFNLTLTNNNVRKILRFLTDYCEKFDHIQFSQYLGDLKGFPYISLRDVLNGSIIANCPLIARRLTIEDIRHLQHPVVALLHTENPTGTGGEFIEINSIVDHNVFIRDNTDNIQKIPSERFSVYFSGIILMKSCNNSNFESVNKNYRGSEFLVQSGVIRPNLVLDMIQAFESVGFHKRQPTMPRHDGYFKTLPADGFLGYQSYIPIDTAEERFSELVRYARIGMGAEDNLEGVCCQKVPEKHYFVPGFDCGVNLNRKRAIHFLTNDIGSPVSVTRVYPKQVFELTTGDALNIHCGDQSGRAVWGSEWFAHSTLASTTYLISFWQRGIAR